MLAEAVRRKAARCGKARLPAGDHIQHTGTGQTAENLRDNIRQKLRSLEASANAQPDGDRGIQMAPGDVPYGVGHREHREAECQRHTDEADAKIDGRRAFRGEEFGSQNGTAAASKYEPGGSKEFSDQFVFP